MRRPELREIWSEQTSACSYKKHPRRDMIIADQKQDCSDTLNNNMFLKISFRLQSYCKKKFITK